MGIEYVLFGAGTTGRVVARNLNAKGIPPVAFADNDEKKWHKDMEGVTVFAPGACKFSWPDATWIATALQPKLQAEIAEEIKSMGVATASLSEFMAKRHDVPSRSAIEAISALINDEQSLSEFINQIEFRRYQREQIAFSPMEEIYFPDWITHRDDEHYVDCGAADGDTVKSFLSKWEKFEQVTAFEPDQGNYNAFQSCHFGANVRVLFGAVSDFSGSSRFTETGDYSAHLGGGKARVPVYKIDALESLLSPPTYIKMDIEGAELEALWGARKIIKQYSPVLAICAYHTADHLWEIPLLIHAIQPDYELRLRRYAAGTWETVWYAVPPERLKP